MKGVSMKRTISILAGLWLILLGSQAYAATVVGGSTLLNASDANQLETWLGAGTITLTNIFTKGTTDTSATFHLAVDGKGPTFAVMSGTEQFGYGVNAIIGGYNPQSWNSIETYHMTVPDSERTAFIFNLSTDTLYRQDLGTYEGSYQTNNALSYGPTFGGGHDIYVDGGLSSGYSFLWSYTAGHPQQTSIIDGSVYSGGDVMYGALEVFTISTTAPVPEPETYVMLIAGLSTLVFRVRCRKQKVA
jgi:hypothetical protein